MSNAPLGIRFPSFLAVDHSIENVEFQWAFDGSRPIVSLGEIALLSLWKVCDACEGVIPLAGRLRNRTVVDVYLGALLPKSGLRTQLAGLRNQAQYGNAGAGIDVGYGLEPGQSVADWAPLLEVFSTRPYQRLHAQMYLKVTSTTDLNDKRVLEVGSGKGDGAAFLALTRSPRQYIGVDLHEMQVALSIASHSAVPGLSFQRGDASQLPFEAGSFDVVVNVESSHGYPMFDKFCTEVLRVLKPGGVFCFADLRRPLPGRTVEARLRDEFGAAGFTVTHHEDITRNAFLSIDEVRTAMGGQLWPEFASLRNHFNARTLEYHWFVLTKPAGAKNAASGAS